MMDSAYFVYLLTNDHRNVFYTGVTNDLLRRVYEHKNKLVKGFSYKYNVDKLVYYVMFEDVEQAILHEKRVKRWTRPIKCDAIAQMNPQWEDLYLSLTNSTCHPGLVPGSPAIYAPDKEIPGRARDDNVIQEYSA